MKKLEQIIIIINIIVDLIFFMVISNWFINFTLVLFTQIFLLFYCLLVFIYWKLKFKEIYEKKYEN